MAADTSTYNGQEKLVFGIDLGTTMSAVSFCHLQKGVVPQVKLVTKWPGQEDAAGDCKVPTAVRYDRAGKPIAFGVDALEGEAEGTTLARWFKLHLHPAAMRTAGNIMDVPPLPAGVALKQVYASFLSYLFQHACSFFRTNSLDGERIWDRLGKSATIVLAVPNGWDIVQQSFLRDVVVQAGVLPRGDDVRRLAFVSEAEASVHFALERADGISWLQPGTNFAVLDAGGSTVDTTLYRCAGLEPSLRLEEVTSSECVQAGGVFVDRDAEKMLRLKLRGSKFNTNEDIASIMDIFEKKTKRKFDGSADVSVIAFGRNADNDPTYNIVKGRITLTKDEVALTFQQVLADIQASTERIVGRSRTICDVLLMVGGFAESPYLRKILRERYGSRGMRIVSIDDGTKKAAAEGSVIWYIRQTVVARASRAFFGVHVHHPYNAGNSAHAARPRSRFVDEAGQARMSGIFSVWCAKNEVVPHERPKKFDYFERFKQMPTRDRLAKFELQVFASDGDDRPMWVYDDSGTETLAHLARGIRPVYKVTTDLSGLRGGMQERTSPGGQRYWEIEFAVELFLGQTAVCAQLSWKENGQVKKGPVALIPQSLA